MEVLCGRRGRARLRHLVNCELRWDASVKDVALVRLRCEGCAKLTVDCDRAHQRQLADVAVKTGAEAVHASLATD